MLPLGPRALDKWGPRPQWHRAVALVDHDYFEEEVRRSGATRSPPPLVFPPARNAVDRFLPAFSDGQKVVEGDFQFAMVS